MTAVDFTDLLARSDVVERVELRSRFGFLAFHGGLEAGTETIATEAALQAGASLYTVVQPTDVRLHVPSHRVSSDGSARLAAFLCHVDVAVSIHGYGRVDRRRQLLLGGRNRALARQLADRLRGALPEFHIVDTIADIPVELRGLHAANPVNQPAQAGVQLELPPSARAVPAQVDALASVAAGWPVPVRA